MRPESAPGYRPDVDGLRAVAVLAVIAFHAFPDAAPGGFVGVDVFFVISGFLITGIILKRLDRGVFSFAEFYGRRIRRIFPALMLVLAACLGIGWFTLLTDEYTQLGKHVKVGYVSSVAYNHSSLIKSIEQYLGVPELATVASANAFTDMFEAGTFP